MLILNFNCLIQMNYFKCMLILTAFEFPICRPSY